MKILALDLGKFKSVACQYDTGTHDVDYETIKTTPFSMQQLLTRRRPKRLVIEIGPAAGWVHDLAVACGVQVQVANTNTEGWRWRNVKAKTDRMDALKLAKLSAADQLPTVYIPSRPVRQWRALIAYRRQLVGRRTAIKNRIRSILHGEGLSMPGKAKGWSPASLDRLGELAEPMELVSVDELWRGQLHEELDALAEIECRVIRIEQRLDAMGRADERVERLRTIPGIGPRTAEALVAAIDDPHRFRCGKELGAYFGLVPRQFESGQMSRQGRITKQGNKLVRKLLVEASWVALRFNPWAREIYERVRGGSRSRGKIAIVAVARHLLLVAWAMLRDKTLWQPPRVVRAA